VRAACLTDGVDFIEDDNVKTTALASLLVLCLGILEQLADILLRLADKLPATASRWQEMSATARVFKCVPYGE